jgi:hypothetical protein
MDCERIREHLEAYALDALEPAERAEVERHLATCAECRKEADALAEIVALFPEALAAVSPMAPVDGVKERLLKAVTAHSAMSQQRSPGGKIGEGFGDLSLPPAETNRGSRSPMRLIAIAVPVFLLILSLMWGIRLAVALDRERDLNAEYVDQLDEIVGQQEPVFEVIGFDDTNRQFLKAQQADSTSYGKLFTRPSMPFVVVMAGRLPTAPTDSTFHVWVTSNGQTTLAGELTVDDHGFGLLVFTVEQPGPTYETAFVTLQAPGGTSPSGTEILRHEDSESS